MSPGESPSADFAQNSVHDSSAVQAPSAPRDTGAPPIPTLAEAVGMCPTPEPGHPRLRRFAEHEPSYGARPAPLWPRVGVSVESPSTALSFGWMTDAQTLASEAQIELPDGSIASIQGHSFTWDDIEKEPRRRMHEVHACGLPAASALRYRVGGEGHWSEWYPIRTLPEPGSDTPWRAVVFGDSRSSMRIFGQLADQIAALQPDAVFFPGDIVGDGRVQTYWDAWFPAGQRMLASTLFIPIIGNHEYHAVNYFGQFALPGDERNFILPIGRTHWVIWDDDGPPERVISTIVPKTQELFARIPADAERIFMVHHQPMYSASGHGSDRNLRAHVLPSVQEVLPDLVFNAHCHNYERSCRIANDACVSAEVPGTRYIVAAGAGANLRESGRLWFTEYSESSYHFVTLDIQGVEVRAEVHRIDGEIIDRWELEPAFTRGDDLGR